MSRIFLAIALAASCIGSRHAFSHEVGTWVVVARATPMKIGKETLQTIAVGEIGPVLDVQGDWLWISLESTGWISSKDTMTPPKAIEFFTGRITRNPRDTDSCLGRGVSKIADGWCAEAIEDINVALRLDRRNARAWKERGRAQLGLGCIEKALADLDEALRINPRYADAWYLRGSIRADNAQVQDGISDLSECVRLNPNHAAAYRNRGAAWCKMEKFEQVILDSSEAIRLNRKDGIAFQNRGAGLMEQGRYEEALADANEAIRLSGHRIGFNNRGFIHAKLRHFSQALSDYRAAIELDPTYLRPRVNRVDLFIETRQFANALGELAEILRIDADNFYALQTRTRLLACCPEADFRDGNRAVADASRACELGGWKYPGQLDLLAAAYAEAGEFDKAIEWQTKALQASHDDQKRTGYSARLKLYEEHKPYRFDLPALVEGSGKTGEVSPVAREPDSAPSAERR
jgi:tetratricopeptide (TPR) repeat protein